MSAWHVVMVGPFGLRPRMTMQVRALPLAKSLIAQGHQVTILLPPWQNPKDGGRCWEEEGVRIENVLLPCDIPAWFQWRLTSRLVSRLRMLQPDIIHAFKPKAYAGLTHLAVARRYPVVVDTDDWEGPGGWNRFGNYSAGMRRFFAWQERWGLRHADAVTAASRALQTLTWSLGGEPERVFYLPNGTRAVSPRPPTPPAGRPTVLLYTRFFEYQLDRLWRILSGVRAQRPVVRFLVVGKGFAGEERRLLRIATQAGWRVSEPDAVEGNADLVYVGWGTAARLERSLAAADLGIYPFDDTLLNRTKCPVKLLDLLAAGIPVVGDSVGQIAEIIVPGKTGILVQPGDDAGFTAAIVAMLKDSRRLMDMQAAAAADIAQRYDWDSLSRVAAAAYRFALHRSTRGATLDMV